MIFPPSLTKGATIGLISPAGKVNPDILPAITAALEKQGFTTITAPNALTSHFQFAATDELRLADLQWMMDNDAIDAILCLRGGYGTVRILDQIDQTRFKQNPKWLIGFSDITALHALFQNKLNTVSIHGPMAKHIIDAEPGRADIEALWQMLRGDKMIYENAPNELNRLGRVTGRLIGGNLSLLYALRGTPYDIDPDGAILFIEDVSEYLYHLDRMMQNLKLSGLLKRLSGVIVGQFTDMKDNESPFGQSTYDIIAEALRDCTCPVVFNFPAGHCEPNYPLPLGASVTIEVDESSSRITYEPWQNTTS